MSIAKPVLWNFYLSSASWRIRIALNLKNVDFEYKTINLLKNDQYSEEFRKVNPKQEVPALLIDNHLLTQSLPIIEYIEETRKGVSLFPKDLMEKAKARQIAEIINSGIQPYQNISCVKWVNKIGGEEKRKEWIDFYLNKGLRVLESTFKETSGKYCVGNEVSIADLSLAPQMNAFERYKIDLSPYPTVVAISKRLDEIDAFKKAHAYRQIDTPDGIFRLKIKYGKFNANFTQLFPEFKFMEGKNCS